MLANIKYKTTTKLLSKNIQITVQLALDRLRVRSTKRIKKCSEGTGCQGICNLWKIYTIFYHLSNPFPTTQSLLEYLQKHHLQEVSHKIPKLQLASTAQDSKVPEDFLHSRCSKFSSWW